MKRFAAAILVLLSLGACSRQPVYPEPSRLGGDAVVDLQRLPSEEPVFFTHRYHGKKINFFVIRTVGKTLSFLDACGRCYPVKRGYRFERGSLVCRECNVQYPVSEIENGVGSCFPIRIAGTVREGKYLIPLSTLEEMADKF